MSKSTTAHSMQPLDQTVAHHLHRYENFFSLDQNLLGVSPPTLTIESFRPFSAFLYTRKLSILLNVLVQENIQPESTATVRLKVLLNTYDQKHASSKVISP